MKNFILIFLTISLSANLFAQNDKYPSKEEDNYYKIFGYKYTPYKPLDTAFILNFKSEYYEIKETEINYEPYSFKKCYTPHSKYLQEYLDSLRSKLPWAAFIKQAGQESEKDIGKIGNIYRGMILKYDKRDSIEAFIYLDYKYENRWHGEPGLWIGYSENNGNDWNYYYTGIVQSQPVFVKHYSQRPLIKEKGMFEIDACLLRQLSAFSHPINPDYECVKDGIYITLDINIITKDSDGDGLTDIIEDKFHTNKYNKDTNGNGIPDQIDPNPRVNYPRTEKSKIYEALINSDVDWDNWDKKFNGYKLLFKEEATFVTDSVETILIVTDDKDLMGVRPEKYRVIFMNTDEYKQANFYNKELNDMRFSPLFKVDKMKNTYKIRKSFGTGSCKDLIRKTKKGWMIKPIFSMIF